jgi:hypothetical protein
VNELSEVQIPSIWNTVTTNQGPMVESPPSKNKYSTTTNIPMDFRVGSLHGHDLHEVTIGELSAHLSEGSFTSVEYVEFCLERIRRVGPMETFACPRDCKVDAPVSGKQSSSSSSTTTINANI